MEYSSLVMNRGYDSDYVCRICLQDDGVMIAPCKCKGSSKWVHRECLNQWRAEKQDRAFSQCTECLFPYHFETTHSGQTWRKTKFCLFVSRDVCLVHAAVQAVICLLGAIIMGLDIHRSILELFGSCGTNEWWCAHKQLAVYYACGVVAFLVVLGLFGLVSICVNNCTIPYSSSNQASRSTHHGGGDDCGDCCYGCYVYDESNPRHHYHHSDTCCCYCGDCSGESSSSAGDCCDGDCDSGGGSSGDGAHVLLVILLVIIVILAIIGLFVGVFLGVMIGQRIIQRHLFRLEKRRLTEEFQVADLSNYGDLNHVLVPPLNEHDEVHLKKLGLLVERPATKEERMLVV